MIKKVLLFIVFLGILLLFYHGISQIYFQQDEFYALGKTIWYLNGHFSEIFTARFAFHYFPLANIYFAGEYLLFGTSAVQYLYTGLFLQAIVGVLFFLFFKKITQHNILSFFGSLVFITNPEVTQVMLNEMVSYYTLSFIVVLVLFLILLYYIQNRKIFSTNVLILLLVLFTSAILIDEVWLSLLILIPGFVFLFKSPKFIPVANKKQVFLMSIAIVVVAVRLFLEVVLPFETPRPPDAPPKISFLYNASTLPFKLLSQYTFGDKTLFAIANVYEHKISYYRNDITLNQDILAITLVYDIVVFYLSILVVISIGILTAFYIQEKHKNRYIFRLFLFGILCLLTISCVLSPQSRFFTSIESRYLYFGGIGLICIFVALWSFFYSLAKNNYIKSSILLCTYLFLIGWFYHAFTGIQSQVQGITHISQVRHAIMTTILQEAPVLPKKSIIYIYCSDDCQSNSMLGLPPAWIVPFQNGLGWNLLILYAQKYPNIYTRFFYKSYLWDITEGSYKEMNGIGYGYATSKVELKKFIEKYNLTKNNIIIFQYNSRKFTIQRVSSNNINL